MKACAVIFSVGRKQDMVRNERKAFPSTEVSLPGKHLPEKLDCDTS